MKHPSHIDHRLLVTFIPQEWIGRVAKSFSPPETVDATEHLLGLALNEIHAIKDRDGSSDQFVDAVERGHYGPFEVHVVDAVLSYFGVSQLCDITQAMLDAAKVGGLSGRATVPLQGTDVPEQGCAQPLSLWMLTYGDLALFFACEARDIKHAISQCESANPGQVIMGAFKAPMACLGEGPKLEQAAYLRELLSQQTAQATALLA